MWQCPIAPERPSHGTIADPFHLQARTVADQKTTRALREAQDRVRAMALVHEHLYNSADLGAVEFGAYAETLADRIVETYRAPATRVELIERIDHFPLSVEQATPCGLILNALLTNCLKRAFRDRERGELRLVLATTDGACTLQVTDDGIGGPTGTEFPVGTSLGLRLIALLSGQLDGTVTYRSTGSGTEVRLVFPIHPPAKNELVAHRPLP